MCRSGRPALALSGSSSPRAFGPAPAGQGRAQEPRAQSPHTHGARRARAAALGVLPGLVGGQGPPCQTPPGLRGQPCSSCPQPLPPQHLSQAQPGLGWFGGPKPTPLQATGQAGLPAPHPEGTVPGRQLGRLEGQRSAVSCPGEIKENRGGLRTSGPAGCQDALGRRLEGAALPFRPITLQPALPIPVDGLHCVLPHHGQGWTPSTPRASPGPNTLKTGPRKGGSLQSRARAGA